MLPTSFTEVVPQLKFYKTLYAFPRKDLSVALLFITLLTLFSFQGTMSSKQAPYPSLCRKRHSSLISLFLLFKSRTLRWFAIWFGDALGLRPEISTQFLKYLFPSLHLDLVGPSGLEPPTLRLSVVRSSQLSYGPVGGDSRDRTGDLLLARQALSQLSYIPSYLVGVYPLN